MFQVNLYILMLNLNLYILMIITWPLSSYEYFTMIKNV